MLSIEWTGAEWTKWVAIGLLLTGSALCGFLVWWFGTWEPDWRNDGRDDE